ncbi:class I SAM-dependent methyltransferase [bacterium]|nr:class I SAM-dependent methyltransferase [bacterium]
MNIKPSDVVLEIGSGDNPHPRSNVLVDKYIEGNLERDGNITINRPLIVADLQNLPFKDKSFDYVICRHVVEHLDDPEKGIKELTRVAKRGYIESPSLAGEIMFGWSFHRWVLSIENNKLIFTPKNWSNPLGGVFHDLLKTNLFFKLFYKIHRTLFYTKLEWHDQILFEIRKTSFADVKEEIYSSYKKRQKYEENHKSISNIIKAKEKTKRLAIQTTTLKKELKIPLRELLICPACQNNNMIIAENTCTCKKCQTAFRIYE